MDLVVNFAFFIIHIMQKMDSTIAEIYLVQHGPVSNERYENVTFFGQNKYAVAFIFHKKIIMYGIKIIEIFITIIFPKITKLTSEPYKL